MCLLAWCMHTMNHRLSPPYLYTPKHSKSHCFQSHCSEFIVELSCWEGSTTHNSLQWMAEIVKLWLASDMHLPKEKATDCKLNNVSSHAKLQLMITTRYTYITCGFHCTVIGGKSIICGGWDTWPGGKGNHFKTILCISVPSSRKAIVCIHHHVQVQLWVRFGSCSKNRICNGEPKAEYCMWQADAQTWTKFLSGKPPSLWLHESNPKYHLNTDSEWYREEWKTILQI